MKNPNRIKQLLMMLLIVSFCAIAPIPAQATGEAKTTGIRVPVPSPKDIAGFLAENRIFSGSNKSVAYDRTPSLKTPFAVGKVAAAHLQDGLNAVNAVRYIAGIPATVSLNAEYSTLCQAGSLVNALNGDISHNPPRPDGVSDALYSQAQQGNKRSNLAWGMKLLSDSIINGYMNDGDASNVAVVGHRRWVLNPPMKQTGFGAVPGNYSSMYSMDNAFGQVQEKYGVVAWPAQNMPVEFFSKEYPFSLSLTQGFSVSRTDVSVRMTRLSDGKKWTFNSSTSARTSSPTYFNVDTSMCGQPGCIIWRTGDIAAYQSGDTYAISISGIQKDGRDYPVSYQVKFFKLTDLGQIVNTAPKLSYLYADKTKIMAKKDSVKIAWNVDRACSAYCRVYNSAGKQVASLLNPGQLKAAGRYFARWQGTDYKGKPLPDGEYRIDVSLRDSGGTSRIQSKEVWISTPFAKGSLSYGLTSAVTMEVIDNSEDVGWDQLIHVTINYSADKDTEFNYIMYKPDGTRIDEYAEGYVQPEYAMPENMLITKDCPMGALGTNWGYFPDLKGPYRIELYFWDKSTGDFAMRSQEFTFDK